MLTFMFFLENDTIITMAVWYNMQMITSCVTAFDLIVLVVIWNVQVATTDVVVMSAGEFLK